MRLSMTERLVPFYRLARHLRFPIGPRNRYALKFRKFLKLVEHRQMSEARLSVRDFIAESLVTSGACDYVTDPFGTFWLYDPERCAIPITRARCFPSGQRAAKNDEWKSAAQDAFQNPARRLSAPPPELTKPGRCNFRRKPVFYGSFQDFTGMAELRPMVGSCLVLAQFEITRALKIFRLNVHFERLDMLPVELSQPDDLRNLPKQSPEYDRASFQYHVDLWMGMPLLVPYSHPQYVARRLLTHTLRTTLQCDGIEFTSSQVNGSNLVIFCEDASSQTFPLRYVDDSVERYWVSDRPVYADAIENIPDD
jgi:RES domain